MGVFRPAGILTLSDKHTMALRRFYRLGVIALLGGSLHNPLSAAPDSIVSLAPHTTEWVYALEAQDSLIAVSDFSDYPVAAKALPSVANHQGIDFEAILRLQPELILAWQGGNKPQDLARLETLGFRLFYSNPQTIEDIATELQNLGDIMQKPALADQLAAAFLQSLSELRQRYRTNQTITVFYYMWSKPLMTIGKTAWANQLLEVCGAVNIFADLSAPYPQVTIEQVLVRKPDR